MSEENEIVTVESRQLPALPMGEMLGDMSRLKATIMEKAHSVAVSELASWMVAQTAGRDLATARAEIKRRSADSAFAEKAIYEKPIGGGKFLTGPSIWLLKQLANLAGHLDIQTTVHGATGNETQLTVKVMDKVSNNKRTFDMTVPHLQWRAEYFDNKQRKTIPAHAELIENPDKVQMKVLSQASKVERNVLTASIDIELVQYAEECCRNTLELDALQLAKNKKAALEYFSEKLKITPAQVLAFLELDKEADIETSHIRRLKGVIVAIGEGELNPADVWPNAANIEKGKAKPAAAKSEQKAPAPEQTPAPAEQKQAAPEQKAPVNEQAPKQETSVSTAKNTAVTGAAQTAPAESNTAPSAEQKETPAEATKPEPEAEPEPVKQTPPPMPVKNAARGPKF